MPDNSGIHRHPRTFPALKPRIFISAVTKELKTARQLVANTLLALGFEPVWQDIFETHSGDIRPMLREKLDTCSAVLQIVGDAYGAEPPAPDEQFGRVSYTQYEALYARSRGKKVYYLVAEANLPRDAAPETIDLPQDDSTDSLTDADERKKLQQDYRANIQSSEQIYYPVQSHPETELTVRRLKSDLEKLRRWFQTWMLAASAAILLSLVGVAWVVWSQQGQAHRLSELQKQANNPQRTRQQLETTILRTYEKAIAEADKLTDWRKREDAKELAKSQRDGNLARVDEFLQAIATVINSGTASPEYLEMSRIFNEQGAEEAVAYIASRKQDLLAKSRASKEANRQTNLLPILEQARKQVLLGQYEAARLTCEELLAEDPTWGDALHEQFWIHLELGYLALRYESLKHAEQLFQEAHILAKTLTNLRLPYPAAQRDLYISFDKLGDVLLQKGQPQLALNYYEANHKTLQMRSRDDSHLPQFQRDLSVSHNKLGAVLLQMGEIEKALIHFEAGHQISHNRFKANSHDAQTLSDLSSSFDHLGDAQLLLGQTQKAMTHYEAGRQLRQKRTMAEPADAQALREYAVSCDKLGEVQGMQGQPQLALPHFKAGLQIRQKLASADPSDAQAQRELSISFDNFGDVLLQLGQPKQAQAQYEAGLQIRQKLTPIDLQDAQAQRDLSVSYYKIGDLLRQLGQPQQALLLYEEGLTIRQKLAANDQLNALAQRDLSISYERLVLQRSVELGGE